MPWRQALSGLLLVSCMAAQALESRLIDLPDVAAAAQPSVSSDRQGGFVLTWQQRDEGVASLVAAQLDREGTVRRINTVARSGDDQTWFINWADFPSLIVLDNGDWVTYWLQKRSAATYAYDIHLTRSTDQGRTWQEAIIVHRDGTASEHGFVSLLPAGEDEVLVMWLDGRNTATTTASDKHAHGSNGAMSLRSALFNRAGEARQESEIDGRTCDCCSTDAARIGEQSMVVYRDRTEQEIRDPAFSLRRSDGVWSKPASVHADGWQIHGCPVNGPALAANAGEAIAIWPTMADDVLSVRAALHDAKQFGSMLELESGSNTLGRVDAAPWGDRQFLLSWVGAGKGDTGISIKLLRVDQRLQSGVPHIVKALPAKSNPGFPRLASSGDRALLTWTEFEAGSTRVRAALIVDAKDTATIDHERLDAKAPDQD